jgi:hypothetical protein
MPEEVRAEDLLRGEDIVALDALGPADLLVGIIALNHAGSVAQVLEGVAKGLAQYFPAAKTAVLVADAGSQDGTPESVLAWREAAPSSPPVNVVRLAGPAGRGHAVLAVLAAARRLEAQGCGLVDADLIGLAPKWMDRLLQPLLRQGADYVSPAYTRTVGEGTLTTNLLAPFSRALYGKQLQQLAGGCAGLSRGMLCRCLEADVWKSELAAHGIDAWLTTEALASGALLVEAHMGRKQVDLGAAQPDLATTLVRMVGTLFLLMDRHPAVWQEVRGSSPVPQTGGRPALLPEAGGARVERMIRAFKLGLKDLLPVWEQVLPEETLAQLYPLGLLAEDEFVFSPALWARVISDFAVAYHERRLARDHLLRALTPLYLGRVAAFLGEAQAAPPSRISEALERIGRAFEAEKESLTARWR